MADNTERTELLARATKAIVADRNKGTAFGASKKTSDFLVNPDENLNRVLDVVQNDPVVRGAITTLIDRTLEPGFTFYGTDLKSKETKAIEKMDELRFEQLLRPLLQHTFVYSNAFIEIVKEGETVTELHMIDPRKLEPRIDQHGKILRYEQNAGDVIVKWQPDEVVHIKITPLANSVWGDVDIKALWTACALKYHIKKLFLWEYETNQFRPLININNANDEQIKRFLTFLQQARTDIKALVPIEGEVESVLLHTMQDYSKVKELLTYLDYEILNVLQVPPIAVGLPDNSNRSNSDAQERALNTRVRSIHKLLEDTISKDLMPKLGFEKVKLKFNIVDDKGLDTYLQMAERMKNMGMKKEVITAFLIQKGFEFEDDDIFEELPVDPMTGQPMPAGSDPAVAEAGAKKSMDMMPSRQGKMPGQANKKIGSGERGTTRKDQLVSRDYEPSWKRYGTIEVETDDI